MNLGNISLLSRPRRVYEGYLFDLDGTVYLGAALRQHAAEAIGELRSTGATRITCAPVLPDYVIESLGNLLPERTVLDELESLFP
jgi:hypothetical protein